MKFTANSKALASSVDSVARAVKSKSSLPILSCILFEKGDDGILHLTGTDLHVITIVERLPVQFNEPSKGATRRVAIPAKYLVNTMRHLGDVPVSFEFENHYLLTIKTEHGQYVLSGYDGNDFPSVPATEEKFRVTLPRDVLVSAIETCGFALSVEEARPAMTGYLFQFREQELNFVTTNGHQLVRFQYGNVKCPSETSIVVPGHALKAVKTLSGSDTCTVTVDDDHVCLDFGTGTLTCTLIGQSFPNYERVVDQLKNDRVLTVGREPLLGSVTRTKLYASQETGQVRMDISGDALKISARDIERAHSAFETIPCTFNDSEGGAGKITIAFNARYLTSALQHVKSDTVLLKLGEPNRAAIMVPDQQDEGTDLYMLVMPVILSQYLD